MAAKKAKSRFSLFQSTPSRKRKKGQWQNNVLNGVIGVLSLLILVFIYSYSQKDSTRRVPMPDLSPAPPKLAAEAYAENPILDIQVEVLNGCGEKGVAGKMSDFLRTQHIDVVRSENASTFDHKKTLIISRNENVDALQKVALSFGFNLKDRSRIKIEPASESDVDCTIIVGKDYASIPSVVEYLKTIF